VTTIGFTGTQEGMTDAQEGSLSSLLIRLNRFLTITDAHHGDCVGSDAMFHFMCLCYLPNTYLHIRPGMDRFGESPKRAYCMFLNGKIYPTRPYKERNVTIVTGRDIVLATPKGEEVGASGTWHAVRAARRAQVPRIIIVWPDGSKTTE
jgi:hypothetical protein